MVAAPRAPAIGAGILGLVVLIETVTRGVTVSQSAGVGGQAPYFFAFGLVGLAGTLPLAVLRSSPFGAAVAISSANILFLGLFQTLTVAALIAEVIALYGLGHAGAQRLAGALTVPLVALAIMAAAGLYGNRETDVLTVLLASLAPLAAWAGSARLARADAMAHDAAARSIEGTVLENATRGERARISRELHDVVAHHVSMIAVQAESARLTVPGMPPAGASRLADIGDTARTALTEMRRLLGVLREDTAALEQDAEARRVPQPGLAQLNTLVDTARDVSGAGIRLIVSGPLGRLDPGVELAAYRIVQEALTNARRHAPGCAVDVELRFGHRDLRVRVRDNGPGALQVHLGRGQGLLGMRERAAAVGGDCRVGPALDGGFLVDAVLPVKPETDDL
jgi:signal transduction histidine kinase